MSRIFECLRICEPLDYPELPSQLKS